MSKFMCHFKTNLSKEIRRLHGWKGPVFEGRYQHVPLSDEVEIQVQRLRYILQQGTKEGLVAELEELHLKPLPCWREITTDIVQIWVSDMIQDIESEAEEMHRRRGTVPLGAQAVCSRSILDCASKFVRSAKPKFHATRSCRRALMKGFREFTLAYRAAAKRLAAGFQRASFPENCYPPGLPFVEPTAL